VCVSVFVSFVCTNICGRGICGHNYECGIVRARVYVYMSASMAACLCVKVCVCVEMSFVGVKICVHACVIGIGT
jgi:hypothetical protein